MNFKVLAVFIFVIFAFSTFGNAHAEESDGKFYTECLEISL